MLFTFNIYGKYICLRQNGTKDRRKLSIPPILSLSVSNPFLDGSLTLTKKLRNLSFPSCINTNCSNVKLLRLYKSKSNVIVILLFQDINISVIF